MKRLVTVLVLVAVASPAAASVSRDTRAKQQPMFVLGRKGGTIAPFEASISRDGVVSVTGGVRRLGPVTLPKPALAGLLKLAQAEGFYSLPRKLTCPGPAGFATEYLHIHTANRDRTVESYGGCKPAFEQLYEVVKAAAALS